MRPTTMVALVAAVGLAAGGAACKSTQIEPMEDSTSQVVSGPGGEAPTAPQRADSGATEELRRLEREAAALAIARGCEATGDCRTAPVGSRPCGGPRYYLVYCARTNDSTALYRKLDELARAERAYNQKEGLASTCEFREPPPVVASGGSCRAAP